MNIIDELEWRGAINQQTDAEGLYKLVDKNPSPCTAVSILQETACISAT